MSCIRNAFSFFEPKQQNANALFSLKILPAKNSIKTRL